MVSYLTSGLRLPLVTCTPGVASVHREVHHYISPKIAKFIEKEKKNEINFVSSGTIRTIRRKYDSPSLTIRLTGSTQ